MEHVESALDMVARGHGDTIVSGALGDPVTVHSTGRGVSSGPGATSESSVTNSAVHDLDIVPWLLGSPVEEVSWHAPRRSSGADFAITQIFFDANDYSSLLRRARQAHDELGLARAEVEWRRRRLADAAR